MENLYDRQQRIEGWSQEKLSNAKITIVGDGPVAKYTLLSLVCLGAGHIRIIGDSDIDGMFLDYKLEGETVHVPKP